MRLEAFRNIPEPDQLQFTLQVKLTEAGDSEAN